MLGYALTYKDNDGFRHIVENPHGNNLMIFSDVDSALSESEIYSEWLETKLHPKPVVKYKIKFLRYGKTEEYIREPEFQTRLYQRIKNTLEVEKVKVI